MGFVKQFEEPTSYGDAVGQHFRNEAGRDIYRVDKVVLPNGSEKIVTPAIPVDVTDDMENPTDLKAAISLVVQRVVAQP